MNQNLFVYGTLLQPLTTQVGSYLRGHSELLGEAYVPGRLYDLGHYPGLWYDIGSTKRIIGQVFRLSTADEVLKELDRYEGIDPTHPSRNEYRREEVLVTLNGQSVYCWCYVLNHPPDGLPEIFCESYLDYLKGREAHQDFLGKV